MNSLLGCTTCTLIAILVAAEIPDEHLVKPEEISKYQNPRTVLGSHSTVYLYQTPSGNWNPSYSRCMKSNFIQHKDGTDLYKRTIEYYGFGKKKNENGQHYGHVKLTVLMKVVTTRRHGTLILAVEVTNKESETFPTLSEEDSKSEETTTPKPAILKPRSLGNPGQLYITGINKIKVLFANTKCVLLSEFLEEGEGKPPCTLWVVGQHIRNPPPCCLFAMLALCAPRPYNAYESETELCKLTNEFQIASK